MNTPLKLTLLLLLFACRGVWAQSNLPPLYELKTDTTTTYVLGGAYSQILEDPEGKYTVEQVISPAFDQRFHANQTAFKGIDRRIDSHIDHYWFRFRIHNQLNRDVELYFNSTLLYIELYTPDENGQWLVQRTGERVPWSERSGLKFAKMLPFVLSAGQQVTLYQRVRLFPGHLADIPPPSFQLREQFLTQFYIEAGDRGGIRSWLAEGILMGFWFILALYSLVIFLLIRDWSYLYFFLWTILYFFVSSMDKLQLLLGGDILFPHWSFSVFSLFAGTFQVLFVRRFLKTKRRVPAWDKALLASITWWLLGAIVFWSSYWLLIEHPVSFLLRLSVVGGWGYSLATILCGVVAVKLTRQGVESARLLLIGIFPAVLAMVYVFFVDIKFLLTGHFIFFDFHRIGRPAIVWMSIVFSGALLQRYQQTRRELALQALEREREKSQLIEAQKVELEKQVAERTAELEQSLQHLKTTQSQLLQKEKMASLGELTAGIAHEIQNPLNFVNNFAEVSKELVEELKGEAVKGSLQEVQALAGEILSSLNKVSHHGRKADSIVKSMLQHSRGSGGERQPTNINQLVEERLRLAYHGYRAKDNHFSTDLETRYDSSINKVLVVPQDIGRVLLNLFNNAFYAVSEKKKRLNGSFEPVVSVSTELKDGQVVITVTDNGTGMPQKVAEKVFQPFFTTKPTGEGTGLGLSLSYDVVTKGHGGNLTVSSKEGEGAEFVVELPVL